MKTQPKYKPRIVNLRKRHLGSLALLDHFFHSLTEPLYESEVWVMIKDRDLETSSHELQSGKT